MVAKKSKKTDTSEKKVDFFSLFLFLQKSSWRRSNGGQGKKTKSLGFFLKILGEYKLLGFFSDLLRTQKVTCLRMHWIDRQAEAYVGKKFIVFHLDSRERRGKRKRMRKKKTKKKIVAVSSAVY